MAVTVNAGSSATFGIDAAASLTITNSGRDAVGVITFTSAAPDSGVPSFTAPIQEKVWGPFLAPMQVTIAVTNGTCSYQPNGNTGGFGYDTSGNITGLVDGAGNVLPRVAEIVTTSSNLPVTALSAITPINSASSTTQTLPSAATAWAAKPYGIVVLVQRGAGVPSFAAGSGDTLRATSGIGACVQYGMIAAQVQSETEWALA